MTEAINFIAVERYWFLTWTTYGTWLPGDERGFVGVAPDQSGHLVNHNQFGTPSAPPNRWLRESAERNLKSPPVVLTLAQSNALLDQFHETTQIRGWLLVAVGIMRTHVHAVIGVPEDPDPEQILGNLKAYGSRRLNRGWTKPPGGTWWTSGGSKRKLDDKRAVETVTQYIRLQPNALLLWTRENGSVDRSASGAPS